MRTLGLEGMVTGTCGKASHGALFHGSIRSERMAEKPRLLSDPPPESTRMWDFEEGLVQKPCPRMGVGGRVQESLLLLRRFLMLYCGNSSICL